MQNKDSQNSSFNSDEESAKEAIFMDLNNHVIGNLTQTFIDRSLKDLESIVKNPKDFNDKDPRLEFVKKYGHLGFYRKFIDEGKFLLDIDTLEDIKLEEYISFLLILGADPNVKDRQNKTPLHYAVSKHSVKKARLLIEKGADLNVKDVYNQTLLHKAVLLNSVEMVRLLIEKGADLNVEDHIYHQTPLHYAANKDSKDSVEIVQLFIEKGADINVKDRYNQTPLHYAVSKHSVEMVRLLIEKGNDADLNVKDHIYHQTLLHKAVLLNSLEMARLLIEKGNDADLNVKDGYNQTPLHYAVSNDSVEMVRLLIEKGNDADLNVKDGYNQTPLHYARYLNRPEILQIIEAQNGKNTMYKKIHQNVLQELKQKAEVKIHRNNL